jgi:hypothetical protein
MHHYSPSRRWLAVRLCGPTNHLPNTPGLAGRFRFCDERPHRRAAEKPDELAPPHSITSSAVNKSVGGIVSPSALAVLRLITNSYLVGCW